MNTRLLFTGIFAIVLPTGLCAQSKFAGNGARPTEDGVRAIFEAKVQGEAGSIARVLGFTKTNGQGAGGAYEMEFQADVLFSKRAYWAITPGLGLLEFRLFENAPLAFHLPIEANVAVRITGKARLTKTEQGWSIIEFTQSAIVKSPSQPPRAARSEPPDEDLSSANAWNLQVREIRQISVSSKYVRLSRDFKNLIYCSTGGNPYAIVVSPLRDFDNIKQIPISGLLDPSHIALSPDEKKAVCGPWWTDNDDRTNANFVFVDLVTGKTTPVSVQGLERSQGPGLELSRVTNIFWTEPNKILFKTLVASQLWDLDTLTFTPATRSSVAAAIAADVAATQSNRNPSLRMAFGRSTVDSRSAVITVSSPDGYSSELYSSRSLDRVNWTPDFRFVILCEDERSDTNGRYRYSVLTLGKRPDPSLTFELNGLTKLPPAQSDQLKQALGTGKRVWAYVYGARKNPLNNRTLGPDDNLKGYGYISEFRPHVVFKLTYERKEPQEADVAAGFFVENGWKSGTDSWGELRRLGSGEPFDPGVAISGGTGSVPNTQETIPAPASTAAAVIDQPKATEAADITPEIAQLNNAIENSQNPALLYIRRGKAYWSSGHDDRALVDYNHAIELAPTLAAAFLWRGVLHYARHEMPAAISDLEHFNSAADTVEGHLYLWLARAQTGDLATANKELTAFLPKIQDRVEAARAKFLLGSITERSLLSYSSGLANRHCVAYYLIGVKRRLAGNHAGANQSFQACLETNVTLLEMHRLAELALKEP